MINLTNIPDDELEQDVPGVDLEYARATFHAAYQRHKATSVYPKDYGTFIMHTLMYVIAKASIPEAP